MNKFLLLILLSAAFPARAQLFYDIDSSFDSASSSDQPAASELSSASFTEESAQKQDAELPFEKIVAKEIQERIRPDASYIVGEPDEVLCFGIARKSPKKRSATINGYAHLGNCGSLNDTGLKEVQKQLLSAQSYQMSVTKISSCIVTPRLALRFRKGYDFVDLILSGGNCPGVTFIYGGDAREFYAKPIQDWLNNFISAVSNDLEPLDNDKSKDQENLFKARTVTEEAAPEPQQPAAPKVWGRRFAPQPEAAPDHAETDANVPPPPSK
ncbi:MAG TPA: hypothetical protein DD624_05800 [Alphaproteobacteria bacterium]|nr:hypothetical protein [Alphaproteobacteria bacterium]